MEAIDRKYFILATSTEHQTPHNEFDSLLFLVKDKALPDTLRFYAVKCQALGADKKQLRGIELLIDRVEKWQRENPGYLKIADIDDSSFGDDIIKPNEL